VFTRTDGTVISGTRTALGPDYGTVTKQTTIGYSRYNGLELTLHYAHGPASVLAGYTYNKSVDVASNLGEQVNPFDVARSEAPSAFDMRHNFVVSYNYDLPLERVFSRSSGATSGWSVSGTTRLSSGFPQPDRYVAARHVWQWRQQQPARHAELHAGLRLERQSRSSEGTGIQHGLLSMPALGQLGNAPRRFFYGPGIENFDVALIKHLRLAQTRSLELRLEAFNVLNHPQFYGAGAVDGNIASPTFGEIEAAASPRLIQLAAKVSF